MSRLNRLRNTQLASAIYKRSSERSYRDLMTMPKQDLINMFRSIRNEPIIIRQAEPRPVRENYFKKKSRLYKKAKENNPYIKWSDNIITIQKSAAKVRGRNEMIRRLNTFTNDDSRSITFNDMNENRFKFIINNLNPENRNYRFYIKLSNQSYRPLNMANLARLRNLPYIDVITEEKTSDQETIMDVRMNDNITITKEPVENINTNRRRSNRIRNGGAFFPYLNNTSIDLTKYQIYDKIDEKNYNNNCLIHSLIESNQFTKQEINTIKTMMTDRTIPICKLPLVADTLKCCISLKRTSSEHTNKYGKQYEKIINLGLVEDHYFLNEKTKYNRYAIENYDTIKERKDWHTYKDDKRKDTNRGMDSFNLIMLMLEKKYFTNINLTTENSLKIQFYDMIEQEMDTLEYSYSDVRLINKKDINDDQKEDQKEDSINKQPFENIYYADFESTTEGDFHRPYMACVVSNEERTFYGEDCGIYLLEYLKDKSLTYFHNLGYDFSFIVKDLYITSIIKTGSQIKTVKGKYKGKTLVFKDSAAMISEKLAKFQKIFNIPIKKEIMPYSLYTNETVRDTYVDINEALTHIKDDEKEEFLNIAAPYINKDTFNHMDYAEFYCLQDCRVLKQGFETFRKWILLAFNLDIYDFISLPSLAYNYLKEQGCFNDVYEFAGTPRLFMQKCVKGGRCMTRANKKYLVNKVLNDFDAVSLYPSAMARMEGFLKGKPKILQPDQLNYEFLKNQSGYFVEINGILVGKKLYFPLQSEKNKDGIRNYVNEFNNSLYVDKIALEDFIKYQKASFNIVRGYYFNEGHNDKINEVIKFCFNERLKQKSLSNPIEQVYKLLMNAAYGKLIQKPITTDLVFKNSKKEIEKFKNYNHNYIKEVDIISEGKEIFKVQKSIHQHFNAAHIGVEVLSMSKRIMNEVMCLAEDLNIQIYYQDTDSMHIIDSQIDLLSIEFKKLYNRELIGKGMGQFHNDFAGGNYSTESIFLGKKCYIDKLDTGNFHIRMKGASTESIYDISDNPLDTYMRLLNNATITFDLAKSRPSFKRNKDFSYSSNQKFERQIRFYGDYYYVK